MEVEERKFSDLNGGCMLSVERCSPEDFQHCVSRMSWDMNEQMEFDV